MARRATNRKNEYFEYLVAHVTDKNPYNFKYAHLLESLYNLDFHWSLRMDENRNQGGLQFRMDYLDLPWFAVEYNQDTGCIFFGRLAPDYIPDGCPANVLEVLIHCAKNLYSKVGGMPEAFDNIEDFFWDLIFNLKLDQFTNENFGEGAYFEVEKIVDKWLGRRFRINGVGSPFPISMRGVNQKTTEIWYQMENYIRDRFTTYYED